MNSNKPVLIIVFLSFALHPSSAYDWWRLSLTNTDTTTVDYTGPGVAVTIEEENVERFGQGRHGPKSLLTAQSGLGLRNFSLDVPKVVSGGQRAMSGLDSDGNRIVSAEREAKLGSKTLEKITGIKNANLGIKGKYERKSGQDGGVEEKWSTEPNAGPISVNREQKRTVDQYGNVEDADRFMLREKVELRDWELSSGVGFQMKSDEHGISQVCLVADAKMSLSEESLLSSTETSYRRRSAFCLGKPGGHPSGYTAEELATFERFKTTPEQRAFAERLHVEMAEMEEEYKKPPGSWTDRYGEDAKFVQTQDGRWRIEPELGEGQRIVGWTNEAPLLSRGDPRIAPDQAIIYQEVPILGVDGDPIRPDGSNDINHIGGGNVDGANGQDSATYGRETSGADDPDTWDGDDAYGDAETAEDQAALAAGRDELDAARRRQHLAEVDEMFGYEMSEFVSDADSRMTDLVDRIRDLIQDGSLAAAEELARISEQNEKTIGKLRAQRLKKMAEAMKALGKGLNDAFAAGGGDADGGAGGGFGGGGDSAMQPMSEAGVTGECAIKIKQWNAFVSNYQENMRRYQQGNAPQDREAAERVRSGAMEYRNRHSQCFGE